MTHSSGGLRPGQAYKGICHAVPREALKKVHHSSAPSPLLPPRGTGLPSTQMNHTGLGVEELEHILGSADTSQHSRWGCPRTRDPAQAHRSQGTIPDGWCLLQGHSWWQGTHYLKILRLWLSHGYGSKASTEIAWRGPQRDEQTHPHPLVLSGKCSC